VRPLLVGATLLIFLQLILGATMRHQHAGLAIPDFPLAYGKLWPAMDANSVALYNQHRLEVTASNPITGFQIGLQLAHRLMAAVVLAAVGSCAWLARKHFGKHHDLSWWTLGWLGLILTQVLLGAVTIWSNKAADIATAHVLVGALSLAAGAMLWLADVRFWGASVLPVSTRPAGSPDGQPRPSRVPAATPGWFGRLPGRRAGLARSMHL
jgi:cytochrome c oxidase assembly protein subunit 15